MLAYGTTVPLVVVLEGGYNVSVSAECMENVALALLDEPCQNDQYYDLSRYWKAAHYQTSTSISEEKNEKTSKKAAKASN